MKPNLSSIGWTRMFEGGVDGPPLNTPFELDSFLRDPDNPNLNLEGGIPLSTTVQRGGRLLVSRNHSGILEVLPLFTAAGATADLQLWGFEPINPLKVPAEHRSCIIVPTTTDVLPSNGEPGLGMAYNLMRDTGGSPEVLEMKPVNGDYQQAMSFTEDGHAYWTADSPVYYVGYRAWFDVRGVYAVMPWVTRVSAGSLVLLGRFL